MSNTGITLCGCSSSQSPAFILPPPSTPAVCLSTGPASPLTKRILAFSQNIGTLKFTCNTDVNKNPFQDCINAIVRICNPTFLGTNTNRISNCRKVVDTISNGLNIHWQKVRRDCGQWSYGGVRGDFSSSNCTSANDALRANAYYIEPDGRTEPITFQLTESIRLGLWNNQILRR